MNLILDGHTLYWSLFDPKRLTPRVRDLLEDRQNYLSISRATLLEMSAKMSRGGLPMPGHSVSHLLDQAERMAMTVLPIEMSDILRTETLPLIHLDPFDRILIAQALERDLTILTVDEKIHRYAVPCIWK